MRQWDSDLARAAGAAAWLETMRSHLARAVASGNIDQIELRALGERLHLLADNLADHGTRPPSGSEIAARRPMLRLVK